MTIRTPPFRAELTAEHFNRRSTGHLPGLAGVEILEVAAGTVRSRLPVRLEVMAPNRVPGAAAPPRTHHPRSRDAEVTLEGTETRIALFRCTQLVLWPK